MTKSAGDSYGLMLALLALVAALAPAAQREVIVLRPDGSAAVGAEVRWLENAPATDDLGALDDAAIASGNLLVTDESGRVELPGERPINVVASAPGL